MKRELTLILRAGTLLALPLLFACKGEPRSAQWYMAHGPELEAKVKECNSHPHRSQSDQECRNAIEAFVTLVEATSGKNAAPPAQPAEPSG